MLRSLALALGCATAFSAAAQGLFDDNEARRRVEVLRQEMAALPIGNPADGISNRDHDALLYGDTP